MTRLTTCVTRRKKRSPEDLLFLQYLLQYPHLPPSARLPMSENKTAAVRKQLKIKAGVVKR